jgi:beta-glucosidase
MVAGRECDGGIDTLSSTAPSPSLVFTMPWLNNVGAVLQCWFAGQEVGNTLADIISGTISPSGKLPVTFPRRIEDSPSYGNFPTDENHEIRYREGLHMGYRARGGPGPLFPFGFGLSYTIFEMSGFVVEGDGSCNGVSVRAIVRNTGNLAGQEVVQVYVDGVPKAF